jgi:hypothetical protein
MPPRSRLGLYGRSTWSVMTFPVLSFNADSVRILEWETERRRPVQQPSALRECPEGHRRERRAPLDWKRYGKISFVIS